ncbi:MAG TPA: 2-dehydro-3-deoxy-D-gluconate 5-dehydrogenase KduD [Phycisphaerae bacterium]|nr:2-dehydro-3-deoxy-D-gluconate 5-dehydrogenase KduD [Phycisphaerae bacterium]HOJ74248.1 2-dehydro-3-deoxy-D-gluconate 5-dehydrogenase KduD [Phycisphaerae bacterium]HOM51327.1 2-dehydro-3-deoxy-D-gluconate 5-dehydrogenase KduD [Phycisphaerae bacterium]HON65134.1 2-dehydro-3-deoxy-D-gluconate 5-dehydrogenase KduD [Phycisphaerae bacterium]HOQ86967.1 2-dehydro-3-deoxy-D-gluconate 5-dehydrogenase KduD [Phycisphaerae bacterium]
MILDLFKLDGKVAIVTGATSGLGQAIAIALSQAGADVAGVGSSGKFAETQAAVEKSGRRFLGIQADLSKLENIAPTVAQARSELGRIDILVNNAGIIRRTPSIDFSEKDWDDVVNLNLKSVFFMSQAVARVFLEQGTGGKIINIASMLSYQGGILVPSYTASKSGVAGMTKTLANEWAAKGINVNAIAPGYFATAATEAIRKDEVRNKAILDRIPAGRWGAPSDLGGMAVFLASPASDYCHGAVYPVDGGWLAR